MTEKTGVEWFRGYLDKYEGDPEFIKEMEEIERGEKVKQFTLKADASFKAENIDDAFLKLANHFYNLANGKVSEFFVIDGEIKIGPVEEVFKCFLTKRK